MKESLILKYADQRSEKFRPNVNLDSVIKELREVLEPAQVSQNTRFSHPKMPVILLVGCPRAGITFVSQLLAATGSVAYPSNLMSRFAYAPYYGAMIQQMLLNPAYDLGDEFSGLRAGDDFQSNLGKTSGPLGVNEFFHFWRRFLPNHEPEYLNDSELAKVSLNQMRAELDSIQSVFEKPFIAKGKMFQQNLGFFLDEIPELKILHVTREPYFVMQSVYQARLKYYSTDEIWWSVKPRNYESLRRKSPIDQIAGQIYAIDNEISSCGSSYESNRFMTVSYESICSDPKEFLADVARRFQVPELTSDLRNVSDSYPSGNKVKVDRDIFDALSSAYNGIAENSGN